MRARAPMTPTGTRKHARSRARWSGRRSMRRRILLRILRRPLHLARDRACFLVPVGVIGALARIHSYQHSTFLRADFEIARQRFAAAKKKIHRTLQERIAIAFAEAPS